MACPWCVRGHGRAADRARDREARGWARIPPTASSVRVCLVSNLYPPHVIGGAETIVAGIAQRLHTAGHHVQVITTARRTDARTEIADGLCVHRLPTPNLYWAGDARGKPTVVKPLWHAIDLWNPVIYGSVRRILEHGAFDVVHTHNLGGLSTAVWSAAAAAGIPIVHTTHDYSLTCVRSLRMTPAGRICETPCGGCALRGAWLRRMSRLVAGVAAPSRFVLDRHLDGGFFPNARTAITPWGLSSPPSGPTGLPPTPPVRFLFLGLLRAHKGVRVMLEAFKRVESTDARLDIAGASELDTECRAAAAADSRITVHGYVSGGHKVDLLRASHVLVFPSISWEVSGLVILEAFAHGLPVIGSRIGGIPEVIEDGVTGLLTTPGDATELAARMESLVTDTDWIRARSSDCRARATSAPLSATVTRLLELYESVASPVGVTKGALPTPGRGRGSSRS